MKKTKILSLILALCLAVSIFSVGMVGASAVDETEESVNIGATETSETDSPTDAATEATTEAVTEAATEAATEATKQNANKWYGANKASFNLTSEEATIFASAVGQLKKGDLTIAPIDVMTKNNSSGKTYAYLTYIFDSCSSANKELDRKVKIWGNSIYSDPSVMQQYYDAQTEFFEKIKNAVTWWVYLVNVDSTGKASFVNRVQINLNDIKTSDSTSGNWTITAKEPKADDIKNIQSEVQNEIANYSDVKLKIIAQIADRTGDKGEDYLLMCYGTKNSKTDLYVVEMHNTGTKQEIAKVSIFDLAAYTAEAEKNTNGVNNSSDTSGKNSSAANDSAGKSYDNTNNANGAIATGQSNVAPTIALLLIVMIPAVLFFIRKRKNG